MPSVDAAAVRYREDTQQRSNNGFRVGKRRFYVHNCIPALGSQHNISQRNAVQAAFAAVHVRGDLLAQCDTSSLARDSDEIQVDNPERYLSYH